jgi:hypothetical protein
MLGKFNDVKALCAKLVHSVNPVRLFANTLKYNMRNAINLHMPQNPCLALRPV